MEPLSIEGISKAGLGNWQMISEHVGTRTKEEMEEQIQLDLRRLSSAAGKLLTASQSSVP